MKKKNNFTTFLLILVMFAGLSLLLYPTISNYWNSFHQTQAITDYSEKIVGLSSAEYDQIWEAAYEYNLKLAQNQNAHYLTDVQKEEYEKQLNISGTGVMGYVEIPSIRCSLPVFHGTDEESLQIAAGHIEWSSLPTGGESTHCVISGHRGLPSAKLFSSIDRLEEGDIFMLRTLDEVLTYEVDRILTVKPEETDALLIEKGKDYCTLVTCTPYGINTHRLLVRGHRVDNPQDWNSVYITADAMQIEPLIVAPVMAAPILLLLMIAVMLPTEKRKKQPKDILGGKKSDKQ